MKICFQVVFLSLLAISSVQASEPVYNGKPLSEWLYAMSLLPSAYEHLYNPQPGEPSPADAVRQIGTNAIPTLLEILGVTVENKSRVLQKLKCREFREEFSLPGMPDDDLRDMAVRSFGLLGTNAVSAIPQIAKLFGNRETCSGAAQALALLGPKGFAALTNGLSSKNDDIRGVAIWAIGEKASADSNTVARIMIDCLKDLQNRGEAARYLAGKDPTLAIPALLPLLDEDTNFAVIEGACRALSSYGPTAKIAVPKLLSLYTNAVVQGDKATVSTMQLMWALKAIDMEAAKQAETFLVNSGPLNKARDGYTETLLTNGIKLIVGGSIHTEIPTVKNRYLSSAELLDPKTGKSTETGEMSTARYFHMAVLLPNGKVLVAGGFDGKTSAELYDPATGTWTVTGSMHSPHPSERMALQPDGKVLVYGGGFDNYPIEGHELYDPATGTWTAIPKEQQLNRAWQGSTDQH